MEKGYRWARLCTNSPRVALGSVIVNGSPVRITPERSTNSTSTLCTGFAKRAQRPLIKEGKTHLWTSDFTLQRECLLVPGREGGQIPLDFIVLRLNFSNDIVDLLWIEIQLKAVAKVADELFQLIP